MLEVSKKIKTRGIFSNQVHFPDIIGLRISFNGARGWDRFWRQKSENKVIGIWKSIQWVKKLDRGHAKLPDLPFPFSLSQLMDNENLSRFWEVCRKAMLPNRFDNFLQIRFIDSRYIVRGIVPQINISDRRRRWDTSSFCRWELAGILHSSFMVFLMLSGPSVKYIWALRYTGSLVQP